MTLFAVNSATDCLYSTVRNLRTRETYFGFLPEHGKRLAPGEEVTVWGDIQHHLTKLTPNGRARRSLENALTNANPDLALVKTPAVHAFDSTLHETKIITLVNAQLVWADPCWGAYSSSESQIQAA